MCQSWFENIEIRMVSATNSHENGDFFDEIAKVKPRASSGSKMLLPGPRSLIEQLSKKQLNMKNPRDILHLMGVIVNGMDEEQIWQQIAMKEDALLEELSNRTAMVLLKGSRQQSGWPLFNNDKTQDGSVDDEEDIESDSDNKTAKRDKKTEAGSSSDDNSTDGEGNEEDDSEILREEEKVASADVYGKSEEEKEDSAPARDLAHQPSRQILRLENAALKKKSWELTGEVQAFNREKNSLLENVFECDFTKKDPPTLTDQTALTLDGIILQRIKDKAFDNVERKHKAPQVAQVFAKEITLDQEKSKLSLAQVYEKEYLKETGSTDDYKDDANVKEMRKTLNAIIKKLDLLSNLHNTPCTMKSDVKIITNALPAAQDEDLQSMHVPTEEAQIDSRNVRDSFGMKKRKRSKIANEQGNNRKTEEKQLLKNRSIKKAKLVNPGSKSKRIRLTDKR